MTTTQKIIFTPAAQQDTTTSASQNREQLRCAHYFSAEQRRALLAPAKPADARAPEGESAHSAGPTPTEYGDRWEPLREKLSISQAQYLNTYTRTGDIAALNCLVLGIILQRDQAREQVKTLLAACKIALACEYGADWQDALIDIRKAIASVESEEAK